MKKSEIRKLIAEYKEINLKIKKIKNKKMVEKLKEIEHKYFHETGRDLKSDFKEIT
jgi:CRISPR/Cas system CSM-associated protein Csm2 small subunit